MSKTLRYLPAGANFTASDFPKAFAFGGSVGLRNHAEMGDGSYLDGLARGGKPKHAPAKGKMDGHGKKISITKDQAATALRGAAQVGALAAARAQQTGDITPPGGGGMPPMGGGAPMMGGAPPDAGPPAVMAKGGMAKGGKNFIAGAIKKPGALHRDLGVPQGEKIPAGKLAAAAKQPGKVGQRARFAETLKGMRKAKGGKVDAPKPNPLSEADMQGIPYAKAAPYNPNAGSYRKSAEDKSGHTFVGGLQPATAHPISADEFNKYAKGGAVTAMRKGGRPKLPKGATPAIANIHSPMDGPKMRREPGPKMPKGNVNNPPRNMKNTVTTRNMMPGGVMGYGVEPSAEPDVAGSGQGITRLARGGKTGCK